MPNLVFIGVIAAVILCLATFLNANFGLVGLIFAMLLSPEFMVGAVPDRPVVIRIDDILILVVFFTWLARVMVYKELGLLKRTPLNKPIGIYIGVLVIATLAGVVSGYVSPPSGFLYLLKYLEYFMLFFMVSNCVKSKRQVWVFIFFILVTFVITSLYGLHSVASEGRATAPFENQGGEGGEPNTLGGYLVLIASVMGGLWLYSGNFLHQVVLMGLIALNLYTLMQTLSRGSYVAYIGAFLALTVLTTRRKMVLVLVLLAASIWGWMYLPQRVTERITGTFTSARVYEPLPGVRVGLDHSASARIESWRQVFSLWQKSPILGYGVTGAGFIDTQLPLVIGETGVIGLFVFLWLCAMILRELVRVTTLVADPGLRGFSVGVCAAFVGIFLHSFSAATFVIVRIMEPFWFLMAMALSLPGLEEVTVPEAESGVPLTAT